MEQIDTTDAFEAVVSYHKRSKHRPERYARSPGYMDWGNQPNPFRFYDDAVHELAGLSGTAYQSLYHFTVGRPVKDPRLRTDPPYSHIDDTRLGFAR